MRHGLAVAMAIGVALFAVPAAAQGLSATVYVGSSLPLSIPVTASVGGRCEFSTDGAPSGSYDAGEIDTTAWSHDFEFQIACNTASRVAVVSANGGLKTSGAVGDPGYLGLAPYDVALSLDGNSTSAAATCPVGSLLASAGSPCSFRGPASTTAGLRLAGPSQNRTGSYLRVSAPAFSGPGTLVSGNYADTLTITIAAAP